MVKRQAENPNIHSGKFPDDALSLFYSLSLRWEQKYKGRSFSDRWLPFAYSAELEEKLARQYELNAQLDLENAKAMDADLGGPDEEKSEDRIENAGIVAEDKGIYMPDRNRKR